MHRRLPLTINFLKKLYKDKQYKLDEFFRYNSLFIISQDQICIKCSMELRKLKIQKKLIDQ